MRVELTIKHDNAGVAELDAALANQLGTSDRAALQRSPQFSLRLDVWDGVVHYCRETPHSRIVCFSSRSDELQVVIEPVDGRLEVIFQSAWDGIRKALSDWDPTLTNAIQIDNETGQTIQSGRVGVAAEVRQKEIYLPVVLAAASAIWIVVGLLTWVKDDEMKFIGGSVTTLLGGGVALVLLAANSKRKKLRWTGTR